MARLSCLVALLALSACARPVAPPAPAAPPAPTSQPAATAPRAPAAAPVAAAPAASSDPASTEAAADAVRAYYAAISARDYRRAYGLWGADGQRSGQTFDQFAAGFADTRDAAVEVGAASDGGGAAGSVFATFPVVVTAHTASGAVQTFEGTYTLRRVNGVAGATASQLRWHLESASLRPRR